MGHRPRHVRSLLSSAQYERTIKVISLEMRVNQMELSALKNSLDRGSKCTTRTERERERERGEKNT